MLKYHNPRIYTLIILLIFNLILNSCGLKKLSNNKFDRFNGERAYQDIIYQQSLGPRIPGSIGHGKVLIWIEEQLIKSDWNVEIQKFDIMGKEITNLVASRGYDSNYILIGAHYDTRIYADQDPDPSLRQAPVPGANDGASGVAVLLELARILPMDLNYPIRLVFFDAEDNGGIEDWDWIMGSRAYMDHVDLKPGAVVIIDMVGDADLNIYKEHNSDEILVTQIWEQAAKMGYDNVFLEEYKHTILDDHIPFVEAGIPAVDIIDFDYPYWHTSSDTIDKVSSESLQSVGDTIYSWLLTLE